MAEPEEFERPTKMWAGRKGGDWEVSVWKCASVLTLAFLIVNWDSVAPLVTVDWDSIGDTSCTGATVFQNTQGSVHLCTEFWLNLCRAIVIGAMGCAASIYAAKSAWSTVQRRVRHRDDEAWQIVKYSAFFVFDRLDDTLTAFERQLSAGSKASESAALEILSAAQASLSEYTVQLAKLGNESAPRIRRKIIRVARVVAAIDATFREIAREQQGFLTMWDSALMPEGTITNFKQKLIKQQAKLDQAFLD
jgi:hypothetical protein